jgi:O-antigen ligase
MTLVLLCATTATLPLLVPRGPGNTSPVDALAVLFLIAAVISMIAARKRVVTPAFGALLAIFTISTTAVVFSVSPGTGLLNLLIEAYLVALLWAICNELRGRPDRMQAVATVWVISAAFWAFLLVGAQYHLLPNGLQHLLVSYDSSGRAAAAARNPNLAASYLVTSLFVLAASPWPRLKVTRVALFAWLTLAIIVTGSNGALLGVLAGVGVLVFARSWRRRTSALGRAMMGVVTATVIAAGVLMVSAAHPTINQTSVDKVAQSQHGGFLGDNVGRVNDSVATRVSIWSSAMQGGFNQSSLGVGVGEAQTIQVDNTALGKSLHNDYLAFLLERGIAGLAALLVLLGVLLAWSGRLLRAGTTMLDGQRWRLQGLAAGVVANLVIALTHESYHFRHFWVLIAMVWAVMDLAPVRARSQAAAKAVHPTWIPAQVAHVPV